MSSPRETLPLPLRELLEEPALPDARSGYAAARQRGRRKRMRTRATRVGLGLAAAVLLLAVVPRATWMRLQQPEGRAPEVLRLATNGELPPSFHAGDAHRAFALSDGSWLTLAAHSELEVLESSPRVLRLALRSGRARFDVRPHGPRKWFVECAAITVEVVGTSFVVDRGAGAVRVQVDRGAVLVRGSGVPDGVQRLDAGRSLQVVQARHEAAVLAPPSVAEARAVPQKPMRTGAPSSAAWRATALRGDWSRAWHALREQGFEATVNASSDIEDLLLLADIARLSGHARAAVAPLERVARVHAEDPRASLALFSLATLRLDVLLDPARAARDVSDAIALGLPRSLQQDAQARLVEAYARAGDAARAQAAATEYRARFPSGSRRAQVDAWSAPR